jgi:DNA-binding response OmpR family regulator
MGKYGSMNMRRKTVLVADDDVDLLAALSFRLKKEGFDVIAAADGYQAFTYTSNFKPDAVILDINMPCGDGFSVHQRLRDNMLLLSIPIIYLTGEKSVRVYKLAAKMNAYAVVLKPYNAEELMTTVRQAVGISSDDAGTGPVWWPKPAPSNN